MKRIVLSLLAVIALFSCLEATPFTLTGELRVPDAYVLPNKAAKFQFNSYIRKEQSTPKTDFEFIPSGMLQVGILNRVELGVMGGDNMYWMHAKVKIVEETVSVPQVAIGVDNIASKARENSRIIPVTDDLYGNPDRCYYEKNSFYAVASKQTVLRGLFGIQELSTVLSAGFGRNRFVGQIPLTKKLEGLFFSAEFSPNAKMTFITEMDGHNINLGAKYNIKNFSVKLGYLGLEESLKDDNPNHRISLGLSYLFDKYADARRRPSMPDSQVGSGSSNVTQQQVGQSQSGVPNASANELMEELRKIRESRAESQKVLEDLRRQLLELEKEAAGE
ncbi:MAG: hypothetical protein CVU48_00220 [Candidatus Cloacimonetes bacterium HGW-Cloacimonetes-1]|nr:MAG: hypothetical protein CVU48_00220 [Candidatus Cloacimonetes bacterium HGW-Cloacimonetes-1]